MEARQGANLLVCPTFIKSLTPIDTERPIYWVNNLSAIEIIKAKEKNPIVLYKNKGKIEIWGRNSKGEFKFYQHLNEVEKTSQFIKRREKIRKENKNNMTGYDFFITTTQPSDPSKYVLSARPNKAKGTCNANCAYIFSIEDKTISYVNLEKHIHKKIDCSEERFQEIKRNLQLPPLSEGEELSQFMSEEKMKVILGNEHQQMQDFLEKDFIKLNDIYDIRYLDGIKKAAYDPNINTDEYNIYKAVVVKNKYNKKNGNLIINDSLSQTTKNTLDKSKWRKKKLLKKLKKEAKATLMETLFNPEFLADKILIVFEASSKIGSSSHAKAYASSAIAATNKSVYEAEIKDRQGHVYLVEDNIFIDDIYQFGKTHKMAQTWATNSVSPLAEVYIVSNLPANTVEAQQGLYVKLTGDTVIDFTMGMEDNKSLDVLLSEDMEKIKKQTYITNILAPLNKIDKLTLLQHLSHIDNFCSIIANQGGEEANTLLKELDAYRDECISYISSIDNKNQKASTSMLEFNFTTRVETHIDKVQSYIRKHALQIEKPLIENETTFVCFSKKDAVTLVEKINENYKKNLKLLQFTPDFSAVAHHDVRLNKAIIAEYVMLLEGYISVTHEHVKKLKNKDLNDTNTLLEKIASHRDECEQIIYHPENTATRFYQITQKIMIFCEELKKYIINHPYQEANNTICHLLLDEIKTFNNSIPELERELMQDLNKILKNEKAVEDLFAQLNKYETATLRTAEIIKSYYEAKCETLTRESKTDLSMELAVSKQKLMLAKNLIDNKTLISNLNTNPSLNIDKILENQSPLSSNSLFSSATPSNNQRVSPIRDAKNTPLSRPKN